MWNVSNGIFTETVTQTNSPRGKAPQLNRHVIRINRKQMEVEAMGGRRAVYFRSSASLSSGAVTLSSCDHSEYLHQAQALGLRGFIPFPASGHPGLFHGNWNHANYKILNEVS